MALTLGSKAGEKLYIIDAQGRKIEVVRRDKKQVFLHSYELALHKNSKSFVERFMMVITPNTGDII